VKRRHRHYRRPNPAGGLDTNTILMLGMGTALLGAIVYAIYQLGQAQNTLAATNDQIAAGSSSAQSVADQIAAAAASGQNAADAINSANQNLTNIQQSPAYQTGQNAANWWNQ